MMFQKLSMEGQERIFDILMAWNNEETYFHHWLSELRFDVEEFFAGFPDTITA